VHETFTEVRAFLDSLETGRTYGLAVGGLPVFLTLTKCDKVLEQGDSPAAWATRVNERLTELRTRFDEYLADGPEGFGSLDVSAAAVGGLTSQPDGRFGAAALVLDVTRAALAFRDRSARSNRRVTATVSGAGTLLGACVV